MAIEKGASFENLSTAVNKIKQDFAKKSDVPTAVSGLTNDKEFQTKAEMTAAINAKVSSAYKVGGSVAFANLPELTEANLGLVVNVTDEFVTTTDFVEGAGQKHPAGTNVVVAQVGEEYKYDVLAGLVDLSGCVMKADIEYATEAEVLALFEDSEET